MPQKIYRVKEALEVNHDAIIRMMESGTTPGSETLLESARLPRSVKFGRSLFNYVTIDRFQTGDGPWPDQSKPVDFSPALSFKLHARPDTEGLVTRIDYANFALSRLYFEDWEKPMSVGKFLLPVEFSVYRGDNFCDPEKILGGGPNQIGVDEGARGVALIAAETIDITSEFVRNLGFGALGEIRE